MAAHVHQYGPPSFPNDCPQGPNSYGWDAGSPYLDIVAGSLGSQFIAVRPSLRTDLCSPYSLHWGSPNDQVSCQTGTGPSPNGQPFGFLIIEVGAP